MFKPLETTDTKTLHQFIGVLTAQVEQLSKRVGSLVAEVALLKGKDAEQLQLEEVKRLEEELALMRKKAFGQSSEKTPKEPKKKDRKKQKGSGRTSQPKLAFQEIIHELDEADKQCPKCGGELHPMKGGFEESEEITVIKPSYVLVKHKRQKYVCGCGDCVETALGPDKLQEGGRYSIAFGVEVVLSKFLYHNPYTRQKRKMERLGLKISEQVIFEQALAVAKHCKPVTDAIKAHILSQDVIHIDETTWKLHHKKGSEKGYFWVISAGGLSWFHYAKSRSAAEAKSILGNYQGVVVADGYRAYQTLQQANLKVYTSTFILAGCWAHARRKVFDSLKNYAKVAQPLFDLINALFHVESLAKAVAREGPFEDPKRELLEERARLRILHSIPIIEAIKSLCNTALVRPKSTIGKAINYIHNQWAPLTVFLRHTDVPISNNEVERAIRGCVVGRKNYYCNRSERGIFTGEILYSILESAKALGLDERQFLLDVIHRNIHSPKTPLLPW